jgi:mannose-1-phosphate guanylyltransferase
MNKNNYVIIMAGGAGTRFWPFSRSNYPKQFHDVLGTGRTLLQQTADRFTKVCPPENVYVVTSAEYRDTVQAQLPQLTPQQILLEPVRRNTAPCIAYACYKIGLKNPNAQPGGSPRRPHHPQGDDFVKTIEAALAATQKEDILVTLGIKPSRPDTGYGYIQYLPSRKRSKGKDLYRKAVPGTGQAVSRKRRLRLERGHLRVEREGHFQELRTAHERRGRTLRGRQNQFYTDGEEAFIKKVYRSARTSPLTSASWKRPARCTWC